MKKRLVLGLIWLAGALALTATAADTAGDFTKTMTPEEAAATGLGKLTPAELARLKAIVERYKSGEVAVVQVQAEAKVTAVTQEAQQKVAAAEAKVKEAETKAVKAEREAVKKSEGSLWAKAKVLLAPGTEVEYSTTESRIVGDFDGWEGRAVFVLENGQHWKVANGGSYTTPVIHNPAVKIAPSKVGGFWMTIEGVRTPVKVVLAGRSN
jgi:hypothetical protein